MLCHSPGSRSMIMWKRAIPLLVLGGLVTAAVLANQPPGTKEAPPAAGPAKADKAAAPGMKVTPSNITAVTVYPNSALVTREVDVPPGLGTMELTVTPLPATTVNSSLYTEGSEGVRVLSTRARGRPIYEDAREEVRKLQDELRQLQNSREKTEAEVKAAQANAQTLTKMEGF